MQRIFFSLVLVFLIWLVGLAAFITTLPMPSSKSPDGADGVIVYTGGGGARIIAGMSLFADGSGKRLLISGVNPSVSRANIEDLWDGPRELFDCCVDLGLEARSTLGNASEAAKWVDQHNTDNIVLVTSDYHMPRAMTVTRARMPEKNIIPYVVASGYLDEDGRPLSRTAWQKLAGEYTKFLLAKVKSFADGFGFSSQ